MSVLVFPAPDAWRGEIQRWHEKAGRLDRDPTERCAICGHLWSTHKIRRPSDWRCGNACTAIGCGCQDYEQARDT